MSNTTSLQKQLYGIAIFEEEIVLSDFTANGERRFVVRPEQLMGFFRSEVVFRPFPGLVWMKSDGTGETYLMTIPAGPRTILYRNGEELLDFRLSLPPVAVKAVLGQADRRITSISLWGMSEKELRPETALYELPLPNLTRSSLCLGSTERAAGNDVAGAVERTIFDTPFNHHNQIVGTAKIPFRDYVKKHKGRCPLRTLNRIGEGREILK